MPLSYIDRDMCNLPALVSGEQILDAGQSHTCAHGRLWVTRWSQDWGNRPQPKWTRVDAASVTAIATGVAELTGILLPGDSQDIVVALSRPMPSDAYAPECIQITAAATSVIAQTATTTTIRVTAGLAALGAGTPVAAIVAWV